MELLHRGALRRLHKAFPTGFSPRYGTGGAGRCRTGCEQLQAPASWGASRASSGWGGLRMREAGERGQAVREALEAVIADIHAGPHRAVIYATGGGAQALSWLLATPGASNTVLEAGMPYARESLCDILGQEPQQFGSGETALLMSKAAFKRAADLSAFGVQLVGVGCAAALMSHEPRRGQHRCYVAVTDGSGSRVMSLVLRKGLRSRVEEDGVVSQLMIQSLASACGLSPPASLVELQRGSVADDGEEVVVEEAVPCPEPLGELLAGRASCLEVVGNSVLLDTPRHGRVMLPGSFNPLHVGHRGLLEAACKQAGVEGRGCFELAILNADKGMLSREEVERRITQFQEAGLPLVLTQAPIFTQKARLFPNTHFVVGHDTAVRLVMPKYYDDSHAKMVAEFSVLRNNGCSFLVAGRKDKDSTFKTFQDIPLPAELKDLFEGIPEDAFRKDISSTELRRRLAEKRAAAKRALAS